jgi:hypothetical protein
MVHMCLLTLQYYVVNLWYKYVTFVMFLYNCICSIVESSVCYYNKWS